MKSLRYLWYVLKHKAFVFYAGLKTGAPLWLLIIHDWSKFLPSEFVPYRNYFQTPEPDRTSEQSAAFTRAWKLHWSANPHHWNYWVVEFSAEELEEWGIEDRPEHRKVAVPMPEEYVREMVADWMGAGRAITGRWEVKEWYAKNRDRMELHSGTRKLVEQLIDAVG